MVTIKQLQKSIAIEKAKIKKAQEIKAKEIERSRLKSELFKLRYRKSLAQSNKGKRLLRKAGKGIISTTKKVAPIIKKQARLIKDQQLRDDAIAKKLSKKKRKSVRKNTTTFDPIGNLGF